MDLYRTWQRWVVNNLRNAGIYEHYTHYLLTKNLNENSVLIDLGANEGKFYSQLNNIYDCTSHVVEASPLLFENLPINKKTIRYNYAIGKYEGPVNFFLSNNPEANSLDRNIAAIAGGTKTTNVEGITFENFLKKICTHRIDVLKIDIEGAELDVFKNLSKNSLAAISQIAVEFHDFLFTDAKYLSRMKLSIKKLRDNKFLILKISNSD